MSEFVGSISMQVNGQDYAVISADVEKTTGKKVVKGSKNGKAGTLGFSKGAEEIKIKITVPVSVENEENFDWDALEDGRLIIEEHGGKRIAYIGCFSIQVGTKYKMDGEAVQDIDLGCIEEMKE